ncbi:hypothetical protein Salat_2098800 [Sesamum alatum]|uniref:Uncharacterized protein n=1 Tax=Sesamum alatum TaxID=300844 RepID=A0AAE1Y1E4_9LAMI|nr:hypothetical protein Salat_2098800 [Sesamum alatum]
MWYRTRDHFAHTPTVLLLQTSMGLAGLPWANMDLHTEVTEDWFRGVSRGLDREDFSLFLMICWNLCYNRNELILEGRLTAPDCSLDGGCMSSLVVQRWSGFQG